MSKAIIIINWLKRSQLKDGSWISDWYQIEKCNIVDEEFIKHKIAYTATISRSLSRFKGSESNLEKAYNFLLDATDVENPLYKIVLRLIAFASLSKIDDTKEFSALLLKKIESGGSVDFDGVRDASKHFEDCVTLEALLNSFKLLKKHNVTHFLDDRFKELIQHVGNNLIVGNDPTFWLWRASLIAEAKKEFPETVNFDLENQIKTSLHIRKDKITARQREGSWPDKKPEKRTITPNLFSDEVITSFSLRSLICLLEAGWIDKSPPISTIAQDSISYLLSKFDGTCFQSYAIQANNERLAKTDPYVNSAILEVLLIADKSSLFKETLIGSLLSDFFNKDLALYNADSGEELYEILVESPAFVSKDINKALKSLDIDSPSSSSQVEMKFSLPLASVIKEVIGLSVEYKYSRDIRKEDIPAFNSWYLKIQKWCKKYLTNKDS